MNEAIVNRLASVLDEAKKSILTSRHGECLTVNTKVAYVDRSYNGTATFVKGTTVGIFANLVVFIKGKESDEDPCYGYSMFIDLEKNEDAEVLFNTEHEEFLAQIKKLTDELAASDDAEATVKRLSDEADREAMAELAKFEDSLKRTKKLALIATVGVIVLLLAVVILNGIL